MTRGRQALIGFVIVAGASAGSFLAAQWYGGPRNFHVVEDGVLYRSGQLSPEELKSVIDQYHIKTVVTLRTVREPDKPYPDDWETGVCMERGVKHARILPRSWAANVNGDVPAQECVNQFLAVMDNPANHPVLVHCFAGRHRTGALCAVYRREYDHWDFTAASAEMRRFGFGPGGWRDAVEQYLRSYHPR